MTRPPWEVADIIRIAGRRFVLHYLARYTHRVAISNYLNLAN